MNEANKTTLKLVGALALGFATGFLVKKYYFEDSQEKSNASGQPKKEDKPKAYGYCKGWFGGGYFGDLPCKFGYRDITPVA